MKQLSIQLQSERCPDLNEENFIELFKKWCGKSDHVRSFHIDEGIDDGRYITINCTTDDLRELWNQIRSRFFECEDIGPALVKAAIVVCEGKHGWNDYLLLHQYDDTEELDTI